MRNPGPVDVLVPQVTRPATLTEVVVNHIREAVIAGRLRPGSPLPEVQLAQQLDTSRGTVREALRALQELGLVEVLPHRGAFVTELSVRRTQEMLQLRALLEGFAARLAIESGGPGNAAIAALEARYDAMMAASSGDDERATVDAHLEFHREVAALGGSQLIAEELGRLALHTRRLVMYTNVLGAGDPAVHRVIIDALRGTDPAAAEEAVRDHIRMSGEAVLRRLAELQGAEGPA